MFSVFVRIILTKLDVTVDIQILIHVYPEVVEVSVAHQIPKDSINLAQVIIPLKTKIVPMLQLGNARSITKETLLFMAEISIKLVVTAAVLHLARWLIVNGNSFTDVILTLPV